MQPQGNRGQGGGRGSKNPSNNKRSSRPSFMGGRGGGRGRGSGGTFGGVAEGSGAGTGRGFSNPPPMTFVAPGEEAFDEPPPAAESSRWPRGFRRQEAVAGP
ncbi:hypothetical protein H0H92_008974, partial [Tricholoma furcatifolium]